jgi:hypothetical protein
MTDPPPNGQAARDELLRLIIAQPGIHPRRLQEVTGLARCLVTKHLHKLRDEQGLVCSHSTIRDTRMRLYYVRASCTRRHDDRR